MNKINKIYFNVFKTVVLKINEYYEMIIKAQFIIWRNIYNKKWLEN